MIARTALIAAVAIVVYVLSIGPVARYVDPYSPPEWYSVVYAPLDLVATNCEPLQRAIIWYEQRWRR